MSNARELAELGGSYGTGGFVGMKNRIINGQMMIDQRNAGAAVVDSAGSSPYCVDRWRVLTRTGATITAQQSTTGSSTVRWHQAITITSAKASPASTDQFRLAQSIEGLNVADFWFGSANAVPYITLSFWSCHSQTGTFSGALFNGANDRSFVFTYTQNAANTWEYKTVVVPGATSGTWAIDNTNGMNVSFDYGSGSSFETATTGSWLSGIYLRASSSMSPVQTASAVFRITGVQLEKGSTATSFDYRPYGTELALCQRYYQSGFFHWSCAGTGSSDATYVFPVNFRVNPTVFAFYDDTGAVSKYTDSLGNGQTFAVNATSVYAKQLVVQTINARACSWAQYSWTASAEL